MMKILSHKRVGFSLTAVILSVITGCVSVSATTQANEKTSQTIAQAENLPNVRVLNTKAKPKASLANFLKTTKLSMEFEKMTLEAVVSSMGQTGDFNVIIDRNIALDKEIATRLIDVTADEALNILLSYDCLSYKVIDNNAVYIYKDPKNRQCKAKSSQDKLPQSLMNGKPFSMDFTDSQGRIIFQLLGQNSSTNIVIDDSVDMPHTGLHQEKISPSTIFNRLIESNCLSYHKISENTLFIYKPEKQKCDFIPLNEGELAKIPELQKPMTFEDTTPPSFRNEPLNFDYYLSKIWQTTKLDNVSKGIIDENSKEQSKIQVKANNQPAYKILQVLSKANCFDIAQLSDKSLFLFPKPTSAKCEPVKNGTMITVE